MASKVQPPYYPIIYVRGCVGTESAIEETVATPYMGPMGPRRFRSRSAREAGPGSTPTSS